MSSVKFLSFAWSLFACGFLCADISLPGIFSDHMVLQQNSSVKIWGTAKPNEKLNVKFNQQNISAQANNEGKWSATIKTQSAGGPF
ncbi:MAG: 9-O-acetylesterase, partial [Planctomycetota bacterium]